MGIRRAGWEDGSEKFLNTILGYYGLLPKADLIHDMMGHLLEPRYNPVHMKYKQIPGVSKELFDMVFIDTNKMVDMEKVDFGNLTGLADMFVDINDVKAKSGKVSDVIVVNNDIQKKDEGVVVHQVDIGKKINATSGVASSKVKQKLWDADELFYVLYNESKYDGPWVVTDKLVDELSQGLWNNDLFLYFLLCIIGNDSCHADVKDATEIILNKYGLLIHFKDKKSKQIIIFFNFKCSQDVTILDRSGCFVFRLGPEVKSGRVKPVFVSNAKVALKEKNNSDVLNKSVSNVGNNAGKGQQKLSVESSSSKSSVDSGNCNNVFNDMLNSGTYNDFFE